MVGGFHEGIESLSPAEWLQERPFLNEAAVDFEAALEQVEQALDAGSAWEVRVRWP